MLAGSVAAAWTDPGWIPGALLAEVERVNRISLAEAEAHAAFVGKMGESAIWAQYAEAAAG